MSKTIADLLKIIKRNIYEGIKKTERMDNNSLLSPHGMFLCCAGTRGQMICMEVSRTSFNIVHVAYTFT